MPRSRSRSKKSPAGPNKLQENIRRTATLICYFDGACEPVNPGGTASFGAVILRNEEAIWECSCLYEPEPGHERETSNNVAEYSGLLAILDYLIAQNLNHEPIIVRGDSKMVIEQMFGTWKIKSGYYVPIARRLKELIEAHFPSLIGEWIPRDQNSIADELSKRELIKAGVEFKLQPKDSE